MLGLGNGKDFLIQYASQCMGSRYDYITIHCDTMHIAIYCDILFTENVRTVQINSLLCTVWEVFNLTQSFLSNLFE